MLLRYAAGWAGTGDRLGGGPFVRDRGVSDVRTRAVVASTSIRCRPRRPCPRRWTVSTACRCEPSRGWSRISTRGVTASTAPNVEETTMFARIHRLGSGSRRSRSVNRGRAGQHPASQPRQRAERRPRRERSRPHCHYVLPASGKGPFDLIITRRRAPGPHRDGHPDRIFQATTCPSSENASTGSVHRTADQVLRLGPDVGGLAEHAFIEVGRASRPGVHAGRGGPSITLGTYSTSWILPSKVRLATMSRATSGYPS